MRIWLEGAISDALLRRGWRTSAGSHLHLLGTFFDDVDGLTELPPGPIVPPIG